MEDLKEIISWVSFINLEKQNLNLAGKSTRVMQLIITLWSWSLGTPHYLAIAHILDITSLNVANSVHQWLEAKKKTKNALYIYTIEDLYNAVQYNIIRHITNNF